MTPQKTSSPSLKTRKTPQGPVRNKERTKQNLLRAVGKILAKEGYTGLTALKIASTAKVDRKLIYLYFGSLEKLIERYFDENDFWEPSYNQYIASLLTSQKAPSEQDILAILKGQLNNTMNNKAFQKSILWEISEKNKVTRKVSDKREELGRELFERTDKLFKGSKVDLRATVALQIAGIYYLSLHAEVNGSTFCGIDINQPKGKRRIEKALQQILRDTYAKVNIKK
ncbi:MAG TPA: TetR/AcrR family transcriptional regulator [Candidatus Babeliaceae bacterium]|nr:TetR/AcrR family transcriptional regulator [Candidatus Babeliaceae bacterium]